MSYAERKEQSPQGNVPNKGEQSQTYLGSAERKEHLHKENVPNLRFPEFSGEWEKSRLNRFASKITKKNKGNTISNVLSNSANYGIIPQIDFFDRSIANSDNTEGYYVIEKNDFVYNPRKSASAPYGPINVYNGEACGIISPLYLCFKVKGINRRFLYHYFKSTKWHPYMYANGDSGARHDRVSIKDETFLELPIFHPGEAEQCKIVELVESLDNRIATQIKIIEKLESLIKGIRNSIINSIQCEWVNLSELIKKGVMSLKRGKVIPKFEYSEEFCYPVYSSSVQNGGLMGYYNSFMFDREIISWSIDGGGHFFYRPRHKFNVTNVCGYIELDTSIFDYRFVSEVLSYQHSKMIFDYQSKAHPSVIDTLYYLPSLSLRKQKQYATLFDIIYCKLEIEKNCLKQYEEQKKYLLSNLFI